VNSDERLKAIIEFVETPPLAVEDMTKMTPMQIGIFNGMAAIASHVRAIARDGEEGTMDMTELFKLAEKVGKTQYQMFGADRQEDVR